MRVSPSTALRYWFRLGWTSFGGPAGQIAIMHTDLVENRRWISEARFLHALNYTMALPGPEAQQLAIYLGWLLHGRWGGIAAGTLFILPSLLLMIFAGWAYLHFGDLPVVDAVLWGVKPVVVAIITAAAWRIGRRVVKRPWMLAVAAGAFAAMATGSLPFPAIIALAALAGALVGWKWPHMLGEEGVSAHDTAPTATAPTVIDDDTPPPKRARFSWPGMLRVAAAGIGIWGAAIALVLTLGGPDSLYAAQAWFFTKVALVTFGGAYAVLPYVYQAVVADFGWLSASQMIDGLALGESTPGPLIMIVAFVAYLAAAGEGGVASGMTAALLVTFFTFLPSYLFILLGAPMVEATRDRIRLTGPLTGITAAVVGLILNLALFFALAVFWPDARAFETTDWAALALAAAALAALLSGRVGVVSAVIGGAVIGAGVQLYLM